MVRHQFLLEKKVNIDLLTSQNSPRPRDEPCGEDLDSTRPPPIVQTYDLNQEDLINNRQTMDYEPSSHFVDDEHPYYYPVNEL